MSALGTPTDEARLAVAVAASASTRAVSDEEKRAADGALDLAAVRLVAELEAERS